MKIKDKEDFNRAVFITIITSNVLRDNLELMNERGYQVKRCKQVGSMYHRELDKFLEGFYKSMENVPQELLMDEIDYLTELVDGLLKSDAETRNKVKELLG